MADDVDRQQEPDEILLEAQLKHRKPVHTQTATGRCFNCDEPVLPGVAYCDPDCRDDHEKRERMGSQRPR